MVGVFLEKIVSVYTGWIQERLAGFLNDKSISIFGMDFSLFLMVGLLILFFYMWNERNVLSRIVRSNPYVYGVLTFYYETTGTNHFSVSLKEISSNHRFPLNYQTPVFNRSIMIHQGTLLKFSDVTEPFRWDLKKAWKNRKKTVKYAKKFSQLANDLFMELTTLKMADLASPLNKEEYIFKLAAFTVLADKMEEQRNIHTYVQFPNQPVIDELYNSQDIPILRFILLRDYFNDYGETPYFHDEDAVYLIYPTGNSKSKGTFAMCVMNQSIRHSHEEVKQIRKVRRMLWMLKLSTSIQEQIIKGKEAINLWRK